MSICQQKKVLHNKKRYKTMSILLKIQVAFKIDSNSKGLDIFIFHQLSKTLQKRPFLIHFRAKIAPVCPKNPSKTTQNAPKTLKKRTVRAPVLPTQKKQKPTKNPPKMTRNEPKCVEKPPFLIHFRAKIAPNRSKTHQ
jgi:hypothetical protein